MTDVTKVFYEKPNGIPLMTDIKLGSKTYYPEADRLEDDEEKKKKYFDSIIEVLEVLPEYKNLKHLIDPKKVDKYKKMDLRILASTSDSLHFRVDVI